MATRVTAILAFSFAAVACSTSPPPPGAAANVAVGDQRAEARALDGVRQRASPPGKLAPARAEAAKRTPISPPTGAVSPLASAATNLAASQDQMVAHFIDVGQGDAVLLEFSCAAVLIDTGGETTDEMVGRERLREYLHNFFARRSDLARTLKLVVLSHPHQDHTDGVHALLEEKPEIRIENVLDNGAKDKGSGITGQRKLQQYAAKSGAGYLGLSEADITSVSGVTNTVIDPVDCTSGGGVDPKISALWGRVDLDTAWANDGNNDSVVLRVDFGAVSFLFTGDLEKEGLNAMLKSYEEDRAVFDVDVLKVGHHGSHNATTEELIAAVSPKMAIIQAGDSTASRAAYSAYSFGHPHQSSVRMLLHPQAGVTMTRPPKVVPIGVRGRNPVTGAPPEFTMVEVHRAVYTTGWDGNIAVVARRDGTLRVEYDY